MKKKPGKGTIVEALPRECRDKHVAGLIWALALVFLFTLITSVIMAQKLDQLDNANMRITKLGEALGYDYFEERTLTEPAHWAKRPESQAIPCTRTSMDAQGNEYFSCGTFTFSGGAFHESIPIR